ncbi:MAG: hypothetical protein SWH61_15015 [Thermodesulfobacteriota bacterium]|nr:hypothetical protein [Thermodesulfobacteriota bacterium]
MKLRNMVSSVEVEEYSRPVNDLVKFLVDWFTAHTITVDKKLADYLSTF